MLVPVVALLLLAALLGLQLRQTVNALAKTEKTDVAISDTQALLRLMVDQESGLRGYQVTGNFAFLQPYNDARGRIREEFQKLSKTVADPVVRGEVAELARLYGRWQSDFAGPLIGMGESSSLSRDDAFNILGKSEMDDIRSLGDQTFRTELRLRIDLSQNARRQVRSSLMVILLSTLLIGIVLAWNVRESLRTVSAAYQQSLNALQQQADALLRGRRKLETTLNSIGDAVITCDIQGRVELMNPVAEVLCGWSQAAAAGQPLEKIFHIVNEDTREMVENPVDKVKRLNRVVGLANHTMLIARDGSERNIDDSGAPIRDEHGDLAGIVLVFRDITQQRKSESALVANQKLAMAGRLSASIAHEIHNPLDSISNLLYLLQQDPSKDEVAHYLQLAQTELMRVTHITRTMLSLYRESKAPVPVELKDLLQGILLLMEPRLAAAHISVDPQLPDPVYVQGFPAEMRQVFNNLITNAAEAAGKGGQIRLSLAVDLGGRSVNGEDTVKGAMVEVADNGPGIPADVLKNLFAPFFTTKGEKGTGLGLWISRGIVQKHGGRISLQTKTEGENHGTTVSVFLPARIDVENHYPGSHVVR